MSEHDKIKEVESGENTSDSAAKNDIGELRRKKKRKAKLARLLGLVAVCVVLAIGYAVVAPLLSEEEQAEIPEDTSVPILNLTSEDVLSISYTPKGGETVSLSYDSASSKWLRADDAEYPLSQTPVWSMATAVAQITAEREIVAPEELSVYGLDEPALTVSVSYADGNERTFKIGDLNEYISCYYMCIDGAPSVYTVSEAMVTAFGYTSDSLIEFDSLPSGSDITFTSYTVTMPGGEGSTYSDEGLLELLSDLDFTGFEKYGPTDEELVSYGLADTAVKITVNYEQEKTVTADENTGSASTVTVPGSYKLTVGGYYTDENGESSTSERWITYEGSKIVYKADASLLDTLISGVAPVTEETSAETSETVDE